MSCFRYQLIQQANKYVCAAILIVFFLYQRQVLDEKKDILRVFHLTYNERSFLAVYVSMFLISLFPILKQIVKAEFVVRASVKWQYLGRIWKCLLVMALWDSFLLSFVWYIVVGSKGSSDIGNELPYMVCVFVTQVIGWMEIAMLESFCFILTRKFAVSFLICEGLLILTNLSRYLIGSTKILQYTRVYDFMFHPEQLGNVYRMISVGLVHVMLILSLVFVCYEIVKRYDYVAGGKTHTCRL